mmetsp:Transcript_24092/g.61086  ORF Transcript_24092/g.61086 Transcript_24092/m.61086 type:complete len:520 (+) Transcript_24092:1694-3253(+)
MMQWKGVSLLKLRKKRGKWCRRNRTCTALPCQRKVPISLWWEGLASLPLLPSLPFCRQVMRRKERAERKAAAAVEASIAAILPGQDDAVEGRVPAEAAKEKGEVVSTKPHVHGTALPEEGADLTVVGRASLATTATVSSLLSSSDEEGYSTSSLEYSEDEYEGGGASNRPEEDWQHLPTLEAARQKKAAGSDELNTVSKRGQTKRGQGTTRDGREEKQETGLLLGVDEVNDEIPTLPQFRGKALPRLVSSTHAPSTKKKGAKQGGVGILAVGLGKGGQEDDYQGFSGDARDVIRGLVVDMDSPAFASSQLADDVDRVGGLNGAESGGLKTGYVPRSTPCTLAREAKRKKEEGKLAGKTGPKQGLPAIPARTPSPSLLQRRGMNSVGGDGSRLLVSRGIDDSMQSVLSHPAATPILSVKNKSGSVRASASQPNDRGVRSAKMAANDVVYSALTKLKRGDPIVREKARLGRNHTRGRSGVTPQASDASFAYMGGAAASTILEVDEGASETASASTSRASFF